MNEAQTKVVNRYGSLEAAGIRFGELSVVGRGLTPEEAAELADLNAAFAGVPDSTNGNGSAANEAGSRPVGSRTILAWAEEKKTPDTLLSLAAVAAGWDGEQDDQTVVTEVEYQIAIDKASEIIAKCAAEAGERPNSRVKRIKVLAHPTLMIAVVVKRLNEIQAKKLLSDIRSDDKMIADNAAVEAFRKAILWPSRDVIADLAEMYPIAIDEVMPTQLVRAAGLVVGGAKKKG